ncbi:MAG: hypothetical protein ABIC57_02835 [bacterium]
MKKIKEIFVKVSAMGTALLALPGKALAASWFKNPIDADTLDELVATILNTAIIGAAIISVVYLIYNGIKYMVSGGDATKTEEAQKGLANAIIGLVVCLAAYLIVNFITGMLGFTLTSIE